MYELRNLFALCSSLALLGIPLSAQSTSGSIVGTVRDASGAVVVHSDVAIRNEATNVTRKVTSNNDGDYSMPLLSPGVYEVEVDASGFRKALYAGVTVQVNQTVRVDASLSIGSQSEKIEVTESTSLVQTDTSALGDVIDQRKVSTLPLNERNFVSFAYLVPGVQFAAQGSLDSTQGLASECKWSQRNG